MTKCKLKVNIENSYTHTHTVPVPFSLAGLNRWWDCMSCSSVVLWFVLEPWNLPQCYTVNGNEMLVTLELPRLWFSKWPHFPFMCVCVWEYVMNPLAHSGTNPDSSSGDCLLFLKRLNFFFFFFNSQGTTWCDHTQTPYHSTESVHDSVFFKHFQR